MKSSRLPVIGLMLFAGLLLCGGCSTFRALFDEDPAVTRQKKEQAKKRQEEKLRSGEDSGVFPALFNRKPKEDTLYVTSSLTPEERALLGQAEAASKQRDSSDDAEAIRRENRERSKKASDSVFGGGVKDWF